MAYARLSTYALGIYVCFISWGILQERLSGTYAMGTRRFESFVLLNLIQSVACCFLAYSGYVYESIYSKYRLFYGSLFRKDLKLWWRYSQIALLNVLASPFGYHALKYINYPTMILAKSCKLVPLMLVGVFVFRRRYDCHKYMSVTLFTVGVSLFTLASTVPSKHQSSFSTEHPSPSASMTGLLLVGINLFLDGLINASQDYLFSHYQVSGYEMMFSMNFLGSFWMLLYVCLWPGQTEWSSAISLFMADPMCLRDVVLFILCGTLGQRFIYATLKHFGAITLVTITVTRKLITILLSVALFRHDINIMQWLGMALVFLGITLEAYIKEFRYKPANKMIS
jgi:solute carrier family 35 (UDP-galactose transporter), member B1